MAPGRDADDLPAALIDYFTARSRALAGARASLRLSYTDAEALLFIADHPRARPVDVATALGVSSAGVAMVIDRLVSREAVRRDVEDHDTGATTLTAVADFSRPPWSALRAFDARVDTLVGRLPMDSYGPEALRRIVRQAAAPAS